MLQLVLEINFEKLNVFCKKEIAEHRMYTGATLPQSKHTWSDVGPRVTGSAVRCSWIADEGRMVAGSGLCK